MDSLNFVDSYHWSFHIALLFVRSKQLLMTYQFMICLDHQLLDCVVPPLIYSILGTNSSIVRCNICMRGDSDTIVDLVRF
jgi:hypothetical protein